MAYIAKDDLKNWIISTMESHPKRVPNSIFKETEKGEIVARILIHRARSGEFSPEYTGFICGLNYNKKLDQSFSDRVWEVTDCSKEVVAFLIDLKLLEMGYEIKSIGKFDSHGG